MAEEIHKHLSSDSVFKLINKRFITLNDDDVKRNNVYLQEAIQTIIDRMKLKDQLFAKAFKEIKFCGSFYKGTKVGAPNEFDLNIILELPINYNYIRFHSPREGFLQLSINDISNMYDSRRSNNLTNVEKKIIEKFIDDGLLDPQRFRSWIEGIMTRIVDELPMTFGGDKHYMTVNQASLYPFNAKIKMHKSGPAFTAKLNIPGVREEISVDLVPVLAFDISAARAFVTNFYWLDKCRKNPWFAVPIVSDYASVGLKPPYSWRLAFNLQENEILAKYGQLKPVIRQMKKLRDTQNWVCLKSYFIETVFFNKLEELGRDLNRTSSTFLFYKMLVNLRDACKHRRIDYFWNRNFNLLEASRSSEMNNVANRINNIIKDVRKNIMRQSFILAKYILTRDELNVLANESYSNGDKFNEVKLADLYAITDDGGTREGEVYSHIEEIETTDSPKEEEWTCIIL